MSRPSQDETFLGPLNAEQVLGTITHNQPRTESIANDGGILGLGYFGDGPIYTNIPYRVDEEGRRLGPEGTFLIHTDGSVIIDGAQRNTVVPEIVDGGKALGPSGTFLLGTDVAEEVGFSPEGLLYSDRGHAKHKVQSETHGNGGGGRTLGREGTILLESGEAGRYNQPVNV